MTSPDTLRRIALGFPEAYEDLHRWRPAFRVRGKIFATLGVAGEAALFPGLADDDMAVVKLDREDQLNMVAAYPDVLTPTERYGQHGWTYVRLNKLSEADLTSILRLAWRHVAPKRLWPTMLG